MHVIFASGEWQLEGVLHTVASCSRAAVICHPHPLYGGNMNNPVVRAVEEGLQRAGCSTLRFNFRGTGESTGSYARGLGEGDDLRAAVACLINRSGAAEVAVAGYSFGAMVALQTGPSIPSASSLIAVAPPLSFFDLGCLNLGAVPKLFIVGDQDQYCSASDLMQQLSAVAEPKKSFVLGGADHFLYGYEAAIRAAVTEFATVDETP